MAHKYNDNCGCSQCNDVFYQEVLKALDRGEKTKKKKKK